MTIRVGFLRAVNLGKRTVAMARLAEVVEGLGYGDVWTHINSGNVVFDGHRSRADVERSSSGARGRVRLRGDDVRAHRGRAAQGARAGAVRGFDDGDTYFVTFLKAAPTSATAKALEEASNDFDTLVVDGREVHWRMRGQVDRHDDQDEGPGTASSGEHGSTSRNITMLRKLVAKIDA